MSGYYDTSLNFEVTGPKKMVTLLYGGREIFSISETVVVGWLIIAVLYIAIRLLARDMKLVPESAKQTAAEWFVCFFSRLAGEDTGGSPQMPAPYIATVFTFALAGSLTGVFGLRSMTADINCTGAWALAAFFLIMRSKLKEGGFLGYLKGLTRPVAVMTPINILSEAAAPVSMALRMFGNISAGMIIGNIVYAFLSLASAALYNALGLRLAVLNFFGIFQIGIPALLSVYFDFFSGAVQAYVFVMLTRAYLIGDKK